MHAVLTSQTDNCMHSMHGMHDQFQFLAITSIFFQEEKRRKFSINFLPTLKN